MKKEQNIDIPMDIYESSEEIVIVVPLGWVSKDSIEIKLEKTNLIITWERSWPQLKDNLMKLQQDCFWWVFNKSILLPQNVYFDKIHSRLTPENILLIVVPKIIIPEKLKLEVESV